MGDYVLNLSGKWVTGTALDACLKRAGNPRGSNVTSAQLNILAGCGIMMDAAPRLLSLVNQLAHLNLPVQLDFEDGSAGVMGYLDRMGFFDLLHPNIKTTPKRPGASGAAIYGGRNPLLVEFLRISPSADPIDNIPSRLSDALENACSGRSDKTMLGRAAYTVFGELIGNIYEHSETKIDGYAAFQVYNKKKAFVAVSDSGKGLLNTLRPALTEARLVRLTDPELIAYMLNEGVSRYGRARGLGLRQSAIHALKFKAKLDIRLPTSSFRLIPGTDGYHAKAYCETDLPFIEGTHINFEFALDKS